MVTDHATGVTALAACIAGAAMLAAAASDVRCFRIPNRYPLLIALTWIVAALTAPPPISAQGPTLLLALLVFTLGAWMFARGWWGGGDVKLMTAAALWAGPTGLVLQMQVVAFTGAALALLMLARLRWRTPQGWHLQDPLTQPMPFGVAIAAGGLATLAARLLP